jgi:hypothetical protein
MSRHFLFGCSLVALGALGSVGFAAAPATPHAPAAPPAPAAPHAPAAPRPAPTPAALPTLRTAPRNFDARNIDVHDVYGSLTVEVAPGPITVVLTARKTVLDRVTMRMADGTLHVEEHSGFDNSWDIFRWLGYGDRERIDRLDVRIRAPKGTPLAVSGLVGRLNVGDLESPVKMDLAVVTGTVGNVTRANIEMAGTGKLRLARVAGPLKAEVAGAGELITGAVGSADIEIAGSGSLTMGAVSGGIKATIAGAGDVSAASINGPAQVEIAGSGSVKIAAGVADPFRLAVMGSGDFDFGGEAVNPRVEVLGSGRVRIKSYRGNLTSEGTNVQIGSR